MNVKLKWCICAILAGIIGIMACYTLNVGKESAEKLISIVQNAIGPRIPTDEDLNNLKQEMEDVITYLEEHELEKAEIEAMYQVVQADLVCSEANRDFNTLEAKYLEYVERSDEIQKHIAELESEYYEYIALIDNIPNFSAAHKIHVQKALDEVIEPMYSNICEQKETYVLDRGEVESIYIAAKKIADDFFEEYYDLMCHIVNAEAGSLNYSSVAHLYTQEEIEEMKSMERCKVARIMELRVKSPYFEETTIRAVVYAPGQYAPVASGSINNPPNKQTCIDMENFLRGRVETGLPENVVYQALFTQGSGVYEHTPSGHYFCYH